MDLYSAYQEVGPLLEEETNLNSLKNKEEHGEKDSENEGEFLEKSIKVSGSKELPTFDGIINEGLHLPSTKSDSVCSLSPSRKAEEREPPCPAVSDIDDGRQGKNLVLSSKALESNIGCLEYHNGKEEENDVVPSGELFPNTVDGVSKDGTELQDSDLYVNGHSNNENRKATSVQLVEGSTSPVNTLSEKAEFYNVENGNENVHHEPILKEGKLIREMVPSDNGRIVEGSFIHSPRNEKSSSSSDLQSFDILGISHVSMPIENQEEMLTETNDENVASPNYNSFTEMERGSLVQSPSDHEGASSPLTEKQPSPSWERSFDNKILASQEHKPSEGIDTEAVHSPAHTPSPKRRRVGQKRALSEDRLPPARHKSHPGEIMHRDAHHRDYSPKKQRRESPRRRDRSMSQSPMRQKVSSTHRRDQRGRSRSVSPHARDHYRRDRGGRSRSLSPCGRDHYRRRRHSPRCRSPVSSYHSRNRSPRRPWSPPRNRNTGVGKPGKNLFVAGFSYITTERDLERKFSRFGLVTDVRIVRDKRSGESRGFGFLSLETDGDADAAIRALDQTEWNGRIVLVEKSKTSAR